MKIVLTTDPNPDNRAATGIHAMILENSADPTEFNNNTRVVLFDIKIEPEEELALQIALKDGDPRVKQALENFLGRTAAASYFIGQGVGITLRVRTTTAILAKRP